jgi:drebrin-like protein
LFPANYVELQTGGDPSAAPTQQEPQQQTQAEPVEAHQPAAAAQQSALPTATAQYDYEAAEDNELSFPEGAKITDVEFPDEDWWSGSYNGKHGLFPANYVELDQ